ncbi:MAG: hypothetical protein IJ730_00445 [Alphaproteobacteria bacterium]|nr:hypothetical protein [Alphaproteobacteria bacterium]
MNNQQEMIEELQARIEQTKRRLWEKSLIFCFESKELINQLMAHFCLMEKVIRDHQEKQDSE